MTGNPCLRDVRQPRTVIIPTIQRSTLSNQAKNLKQLKDALGLNLIFLLYDGNRKNANVRDQQSKMELQIVGCTRLTKTL